MKMLNTKGKWSTLLQQLLRLFCWEFKENPGFFGQNARQESRHLFLILEQTEIEVVLFLKKKKQNRTNETRIAKTIHPD